MTEYIELKHVIYILKRIGALNEKTRAAVRAVTRTDLAPVITCDRCKYGEAVEKIPNERASSWFYDCKLHNFRRGCGYYCFDGLDKNAIGDDTGDGGIQ